MTEPEFARDFMHGFKTSFQRGFRNAYRTSLYAGMAGSFLAVRWLERSSPTRDIRTSDELTFAASGAGIAVLLVCSCRWIIRRFNRRHVA